MRLSEKLAKVASWLEGFDNELLIDAEESGKEEVMMAVAEALILAGEIMKSASETVADVEPKSDELIDKMDEMVAVANQLDLTGDVELIKEASVLDEIIFLMADGSQASRMKQAKDDARLEDLKKIYTRPKEKLDELNKVSETEKLIEKAPVYEEHKQRVGFLDTRYCPDHSGIPVSRVSDRVVKCSLDGKVYDYNMGYTLLNGDRVVGSSVENQTKQMWENVGHTIFNADTRETRLGLAPPSDK